MSMSESTYIAERARQTEILHKAVEKAVQDAAEQFDTPMLNAVIGAFVVCLAASLASVGDQRARKQLRQLVDRELSSQIASIVSAGRPTSRTIIVTGGMH